MKKIWWWSPVTLEEYCSEAKKQEDWQRGRLPYQYWSDERKESYQKTRKDVVWSQEAKDKASKRAKKSQTDKVGYTDGTTNIWLRIGQDVPEGFYRGWTVDDPTKYWRNERKWQKQLMEEVMSQKQ